MLDLRIDGNTQFQGDRIQKLTTETKAAGTFADVMKSTRIQLKNDSLKGLMDRVDLQGHKLAKQRTLENLLAYKAVVKQFISEALSYGLQLSEKQSEHPYGGMQTHQLVEVIDDKMLEVQDEVLRSEEDGLDTLRLVGEVKGLLLNLYM